MAKFFKSTTLLAIGLVCSLLLLPNAPSYANTSSSSNLKSASHYFKKGLRYEKKRSIKNAIKWYRKAANKSHRRAQYRLGILYYKQKNYKKAKHWLKKRAKAGEPDAQYHYANILRFGLGTKRKSWAAKKWYLKAAKQGHKQAQYELALMYKKGIGTKRSLKNAKKWFKRAAKKNHRQAKQALRLLRKQKSVKVNKQVKPVKKEAKAVKIKPKKAKQVTKKKTKKKPVFAMQDSAELGNAEHQYDLGMRYLLGYKTSPDSHLAIYWLNLAAKQNHAEAMYQLGSEYLKGKLVQRDIKKAIRYFAQASNKKVKAAGTALTIYAENGYKNLVEAEIGDKAAQLKLAQANLEKPDLASQQYGLEWLIKAADQAYPIALMELAQIYEAGLITPKSYEKAFLAYQAAANLNHALAQYRLGRMYQSGIGTSVNQQLAFRWFEKAASQGLIEAQQALQFSGI